MGQKIEGYWDCPYCGRKANRGSQRDCPSCGKPRGSSTKFYLIEKDKFVSDDVVPKGPDWYCECCDSYNTYSASFCKSCGAPKGASKNYFQIKAEEEKNDIISKRNGVIFDIDEWARDCDFEDSSTNHNNSEMEYDFAEPPTYHNNSEMEHDYTEPKSLIKQNNSKVKHDIPWKTIVIALLAFLLIGTLCYFIIPKEVTLRITETSWERSINIEKYKTVRESDWSIPTGGRKVYTQNEIHHYDTVLDHYETRYVTRSETVITGYRTVTEHIDLGNGYFDTRTSQEPEYGTRYYTEAVQEPVYIQVPVFWIKYYYDIERWVFDRTEKSNGSASSLAQIEEIPYWPSISLEEDEREGSRNEQYKICGFNVKDKNQNIKEYSIEYENWRTIKPGDVITGMVSLGFFSIKENN